jgi:hypothetical protein
MGLAIVNPPVTLPRKVRDTIYHFRLSGRQFHAAKGHSMLRTPRPWRLRTVIVYAILAVFLLPLAIRASLYAFGRHPTSWFDADWSSSGLLPPADADPRARVLIMSGRTGGLKGVFAVHSWIVLKAANSRTWTRYDVAGWGNPIKINNWPADGFWYGSRPIVVADVTGKEAEALIPKIEAAVTAYQYHNAGDYRLWPGPNSNTFVASVLRAVPEIGAALPPNAIGRDFRPLPYAGLSDSRTGIELNLCGLLGIKFGWIEGIEVNVLGLVAGIDLRHFGVKLPGFGLVGFSAGPAAAAPAAARQISGRSPKRWAPPRA